MRKIFPFLLLLSLATTASAQNPQAQTNPSFAVNAGMVNGIGPGYAPGFPATGLSESISAGTAYCAGAIVTYAGGNVTVSNNTTNYIYLDTTSSCVPATSTSTFTNLQIPLALVVTSGGNITSVTDERLAALPSSGLPCAPPTSPNGVPYVVTSTASGSAAQPSVCSLPGLPSRSVAGATDTIVASDCSPKRIKYTDTMAVAVTLPTATTLGVPACTFVVLNASTSAINVTVTPTTWSIDRGQGAGPVSTLVVAQHQKCVISVSAAGGQWDADCVTTN